MNYWLIKSEPSVFSWKDLLASPEQITFWEGVRNYQARNYLKTMKKGDLCLFYHSNANPLAIAGIAIVAEEATPDPTALDSRSDYFDPKASPENPRWFGVRVKAHREFSPPVLRSELSDTPELFDMLLLQKGSRLSVQPVKKEHYQIILSLREKEK